MQIKKKAVTIVSKTLPLTTRVQKGLALIKESRYQKKAHWGEGLTVLNEETVKLPLVKRKALAIKKILSEMPIDIKDYELIVGSAIQGSTAVRASLPEYATQEEVKAAAKKLTETTSVFGHFSPYYPRYLKLGLGGLRKMAEEKLEKVRQKGTEPEKEAWYESVIISLDGLKELIRRHEDLASQLMDSETNLTRKAELHEIARVSQHLLQGPPQTFREALQAFWFAHIALFSTLNHLPIGRFDQNLWPYLERDLENGAITISEAQELVDCFWLKCNDLLQAFQLQEDSIDSARASRIGSMGVFLGGRTSRARTMAVAAGGGDGGSSQQFLQTITLSGLTPEGLDGTNPLTYLCLNALFRL